jgi:hypothetical protein
LRDITDFPGTELAVRRAIEAGLNSSDIVNSFLSLPHIIDAIFHAATPISSIPATRNAILSLSIWFTTQILIY